MSFVGILQFVVYILILIWLLKKKYGEKYSWKSLLRFWACGAVSLLIGISLPLQKDMFYGLKNPLLIGFVTAFLMAGLLEEVLKYLMFRLAIFKNKEVVTWMDAIIAAVFVGAGFGMTEALNNVLGGAVNILRAFVPMHLFFQFVMGYFYGKARVTKQKKYDVYALVVPILLHTVFDMFILGILSVVSPEDLGGKTVEQLQNMPYGNYILVMGVALVVIVAVSFVALIVTAVKISKWKKRGEKQELLAEPVAKTEEAV